jgi:MarR family 2-MHQ and catechol resistance regulon transcriptional repressor
LTSLGLCCYVVSSNDMAAASAPEPAVSADLQRDAEGLQLALAELVRVYQFRDRDKICCHDISVTQCYALETLVQHGPLRLGGLAERLFLDKSTTSRVVGTLVKKGYVQQRPDAADARAVAISATSRGEKLCARINVDLVEQQRQLLEDLEPSVRAGVVEVIRRLAHAADARFRSGVSVGPAVACCAPDDVSRAST